MLTMAGVVGAARAQDWAGALAELDPAVAGELAFLIRGGPDLEEGIEVYRRAAWVAGVALDELTAAEDAHFAALDSDAAAELETLGAEVIAAQESYGAALAAERAALMQMTGGLPLSGEAELALRAILLP
jgi:hypothetical protein